MEYETDIENLIGIIRGDDGADEEQDSNNIQETN